MLYLKHQRFTYVHHQVHRIEGNSSERRVSECVNKTKNDRTEIERERKNNERKKRGKYSSEEEDCKVYKETTGQWILRCCCYLYCNIHVVVNRKEWRFVSEQISISKKMRT